MSTVALILFYTCCITPILLHIVGIYILCSTKYSTTFNKVQRFYILNLSAAELTLSLVIFMKHHIKPYVSREVLYYVQCVEQGYISCLLYIILFIITIDRFLMVHLNFHYHLVITVKKVRLIFSLVYTALLMVPLTLAVTSKNDPDILYRNILFYFFMPADVTFTLSVSSIYGYIMYTRRARDKITKTKSKALQKQNNLRIQTLLPALIIFTFFLFVVIPHLTYTCFKLLGIQVNELMQISLNTSYGTALSLDALLYIFSCKSIRRRMFNWKNLF